MISRRQVLSTTAVLPLSGIAVATRAEIPRVRVAIAADEVLADVSARPLGINADIFLDDSANRPMPVKRSYAEALADLGASFVRYPGGWKADAVYWSEPPFTGAAPPALIRIGPHEWPANDRRLFDASGRWLVKPLGFDDFVAACRRVGAQPTCVVAYSSLHWPQSQGGSPPPRKEDLLAAAEGWVRYANLEKSYGIRCWEIGNETYLGGNFEGMRYTAAPAAAYAADVAVFARRMKAVDPTILVGANGDREEWWREVLEAAGKEIDFLAVHTYPCYGWKGNDVYHDRAPNPRPSVDRAARALAAYATKEEAAAKRIRIAVTEYAAGFYNEADHGGADTLRGLITFEMLGHLLNDPRVWYSQFWTTTNVYERQPDPYRSVFSALAADNTLTAVGRAIALWSRFLAREMVPARSHGQVVAFATRTPGEKVIILLVNKDSSETDADVVGSGVVSPAGEGGRWEFKGTGPGDPDPTTAAADPVAVRDGTFSVRLPPCSITVITLPLRPA